MNFTKIIFCFFTLSVISQISFSAYLDTSPNNRIKYKNYNEALEIAQNSKKSMTDRWVSLVALSKLNSLKAQEDYQKLIKSKEWYIKNACLIGLESIDLNLAKKSARKLIHDPALVVRSEAIRILSMQLSSEDRDLFWQELFHKINFRKGHSLWIRSQIARALMASPLKSESSLVSNLKLDIDPEVKKLALEKSAPELLFEVNR